MEISFSFVLLLLPPLQASSNAAKNGSSSSKSKEDEDIAKGELDCRSSVKKQGNGNLGSSAAQNGNQGHSRLELWISRCFPDP